MSYGYCYYYSDIHSKFRQSNKKLKRNTKNNQTLFLTYSPISELWEELRPPLQPPNKFTARMLSQSLMEDTQTPPPACASQSLNQAKLVRKEAPWRVGGFFFFFLQNNSVAVCIWVCETRLYPLMRCFTSLLWWKQCQATGHVNGNAQWLTSRSVMAVAHPSVTYHIPPPTPKHGPPLRAKAFPFKDCAIDC